GAVLLPVLGARSRPRGLPRPGAADQAGPLPRRRADGPRHHRPGRPPHAPRGHGRDAPRDPRLPRRHRWPLTHSAERRPRTPAPAHLAPRAPASAHLADMLSRLADRSLVIGLFFA